MPAYSDENVFVFEGSFVDFMRMMHGDDVFEEAADNGITRDDRMNYEILAVPEGSKHKEALSPMAQALRHERNQNILIAAASFVGAVAAFVGQVLDVAPPGSTGILLGVASIFGIRAYRDHQHFKNALPKQRVMTTYQIRDLKPAL